MKLAAHAKVNLGLRVTGRRPDGYHEIDSYFLSVDLHDLVDVEPGDEGLEVWGPEATAVPVDDTNLVARAVAATGTQARIVVGKHIPTGAGLGGASADAAAALHGLGHGEDLEMGAGLGADVPFCMTGGAARVAGVGQRLSPAELPEDLWLVLVVPPARLSTAAVYAEWDRGGPGLVEEIEVPGVGRVGNELFGPAGRLAPSLGATAAALGRITGRPWLMTGSGSGLLLPAPDGDEAGALAARVRGRVLCPAPRGVERVM